MKYNKFFGKSTIYPVLSTMWGIGALGSARISRQFRHPVLCGSYTVSYFRVHTLWTYFQTKDRLKV